VLDALVRLLGVVGHVLLFLGAATLLVLRHVPFGYVLFSTNVAYERPNAQMLSNVHFKVRSGVVFLVAARKFTMELVDVLVCSLMVSQNPFLSEH